MKFLQIVKTIFILSALSMLLSCSSTDDVSSQASSGRVSLLITDAPSNDFDQINITLESVSFIGGDDGHETIVFDEPRVINLLALQNYSNLLTTTIIPAGSYSKIRLHVSQVELVKLDANGDVLESHIAKLPANGKIDLNPRGAFEVVAGGHLMVELDVDAAKSIHVVKTGKGYNFRPVIFVNILGEEELKLVVLDGKVLARTESGFQLCKIEAIEVNDNCLEVFISDDTVVQNDLIEVVAESAVVDNSIVTVLGKASNKNVKALHIIIAADAEKAQNLALFTGKATSGVSENTFDMITDDDNGVVTPHTDLVITLAEGAGIFDEYGMSVATEYVVNGSDVDVFGLAIPDLSTVNGVKAAFVIVDNDIESEKTSGLITAINNIEKEITITVVSELFSGDVCVDITAAELFLLAIVDESISTKEIIVNELQLGMSVDVYGDATAGCISANVVLVIGN